MFICIFSTFINVALLFIYKYASTLLSLIHSFTHSLIHFCCFLPISSYACAVPFKIFSWYYFVTHLNLVWIFRRRTSQLLENRVNCIAKVANSFLLYALHLFYATVQLDPDKRVLIHGLHLPLVITWNNRMICVMFAENGCRYHLRMCRHFSFRWTGHFNEAPSQVDQLLSAHFSHMK